MRRSVDARTMRRRHSDEPDPRAARAEVDVVLDTLISGLIARSAT